MKRYNSYNNGDIVFSCREAAKILRISKSTAGLAFSELIDRGFLKVARASTFSLKTKESRRWEITCWPPVSGKPPSNDWRKWKAENLKHGTTSCPERYEDEDKLTVHNK
jgi:DNA-binding transcriptional MocR family regulator